MVSFPSQTETVLIFWYLMPRPVWFIFVVLVCFFFFFPLLQEPL